MMDLRRADQIALRMLNSCDIKYGDRVKLIDEDGAGTAINREPSQYGVVIEVKWDDGHTGKVLARDLEWI